MKYFGGGKITHMNAINADNGGGGGVTSNLRTAGLFDGDIKNAEQRNNRTVIVIGNGAGGGGNVCDKTSNIGLEKLVKR